MPFYGRVQSLLEPSMTCSTSAARDGSSSPPTPTRWLVLLQKQDEQGRGGQPDQSGPDDS